MKRRWFWVWETIDGADIIYYCGLFALLYKTRRYYPELRFYQRWSWGWWNRD